MCERTKNQHQIKVNILLKNELNLKRKVKVFKLKKQRTIRH